MPLQDQPAACCSVSAWLHSMLRCSLCADAKVLNALCHCLQIIQLAMDRRGREREQASLALCALASAGLHEKQLCYAFEELLLCLEVRCLVLFWSYSLLALF